MKKSDTKAAGNGIGFLSLLGLLFIGLKLGGVIDWSWWWVLSPFWGPWALLAGIAVLFYGIAAVAYGIAALIDLW